MVKVRTPDSYSILDFTLGGINKTPIYLSIRITQYLMPVMYLMIIIELCNWIKKHSVHTWLQDIPRQLNGSDCGVFVCRYAECISQGTNMEFTQVGRLIQIKFLNVKRTYGTAWLGEKRETHFSAFLSFASTIAVIQLNELQMWIMTLTFVAEQSKNQTFYILDKYLFHATFEACLHCGRW